MSSHLESAGVMWSHLEASAGMWQSKRKLTETHDPNQTNLDSDARANNTFGNAFGLTSVGGLGKVD